MTLHPLLVRQLRRLYGDEVAWPQGVEALLAAVSQAYVEAETDRCMIERALEVMSQELTARHEQQQRELVQRQQARDELQRRSEEQQQLIRKLEEAHHQLLQSEKLASIGQLAAGVAHEINNPIAFVGSNIGTLQEYVRALLVVVDAYEAQRGALGADALHQIDELKARSDFDYLREDALALLDESAEGVQRVKRIVQDLKDFSHVGEDAWMLADLHKGLDSTLNIVHNELKYVADVQRSYGELPPIECRPSQLNQVFMNLLVNAGHAIKGKPRRGLIQVRSGRLAPAGEAGEAGEEVFVEVSDDGCGIAPEHLSRIFDPFFTTKPVGQGTGLGLSLAYGIVRSHGGRIEVLTERGRGTTFRVVLPVRRASADAAAAAETGAESAAKVALHSAAGRAVGCVERELSQTP